MRISISTVNNNLKEVNKTADKIEKLLGKHNIPYCCVTVEE